MCDGGLSVRSNELSVRDGGSPVRGSGLSVRDGGLPVRGSGLSALQICERRALTNHLTYTYLYMSLAV